MQEFCCQRRISPAACLWHLHLSSETYSAADVALPQPPLRWHRKTNRSDCEAEDRAATAMMSSRLARLGLLWKSFRQSAIMQQHQNLHDVVKTLSLLRALLHNLSVPTATSTLLSRADRDQPATNESYPECSVPEIVAPQSFHIIFLPSSFFMRFRIGWLVDYICAAAPPAEPMALGRSNRLHLDDNTNTIQAPSMSPSHFTHSRLSHSFTHFLLL